MRFHGKDCDINLANWEALIAVNKTSKLLSLSALKEKRKKENEAATAEALPLINSLQLLSEFHKTESKCGFSVGLLVWLAIVVCGERLPVTRLW